MRRFLSVCVFASLVVLLSVAADAREVRRSVSRQRLVRPDVRREVVRERHVVDAFVLRNNASHCDCFRRDSVILELRR